MDYEKEDRMLQPILPKSVFEINSCNYPLTYLFNFYYKKL